VAISTTTSSPKIPLSSYTHAATAEPCVGGPLRVLHIVNRLDTGGTELVVLKLIGGLSDGVFEHRLASLRGMDPRLEGVPLPGGELLTTGKIRSGLQFPLFRLVKLIRTYRPHIVHSRNWGTIEAIPAARLARVPVAVHSEHGYELDMLSGLPKRRRVFLHAVYQMADVVLAVTRELRDYHARQAWVAPERIRVIYNGVDAVRFCPHPELRKLLRRRFGLPEERFLVGTVGRMVPIKDHPTLLRALEMLLNRGIDAHAVFVGSGPEFQRNQQLVNVSTKLRGRVSFVGYSEEVSQLLNTLDAFALPSISEGMSNTLLEAMAVGLPVIATRVGGNIEVVEHGRFGWLFEPGDAEALASSLALFASHEKLRWRYGAAARQRIVEHFSLECMLESYRRLYLELAIRRGISRRMQ
jgi:sugar transferase (PEP-CTERM/EpsH1 system associated)